jgi:hypothetical protein
MKSSPGDFGDLHDRLVDRLVILEKQNRRFKQLGAALLVLLASLAVMGQAPSKKVVEANEFVLRDDAGKVRAKLLIDQPFEKSALLLYDEK